MYTKRCLAWLTALALVTSLMPVCTPAEEAVPAAVLTETAAASEETAGIPELPEEMPAETAPEEESGPEAPAEEIPEKADEALYPWSGMDDAAFLDFLQASQNEELLRALLSDAGSPVCLALLARLAAIADSSLRQRAEQRLNALTAAEEPSGEAIPEESAREEIPAEAPAGEDPAEAPAEEIPAEGSAEEAPSEVPAEEIPAEGSAEEAPSEVPAEEASPEEPTEAVPAEVPAEDVSSEEPAGDAAWKPSEEDTSAPPKPGAGAGPVGGAFLSIPAAGGETAANAAYTLNLCSSGDTTEAVVNIPDGFTLTSSTGTKAVYTCASPEMTLTLEIETSYHSAQASFAARSGSSDVSRAEYRLLDGGVGVLSSTTGSGSRRGVLDVAVRDFSFVITMSAPSLTSEVTGVWSEFISGLQIIVPAVSAAQSVDICYGGSVEAVVAIPENCLLAGSDANTWDFLMLDGTAEIVVQRETTYYTPAQSFASRSGAPAYYTVDGVTGVLSESGTGAVYFDGAARDVSFVISVYSYSTAQARAIWAQIENGTRFLIPPEEGSTGGGVDAFVRRLYSICLGRTASSSEISYYAARLSTGLVTGVEAAYFFVFSQEFRNFNLCNDHYVAALYQAFFGREGAAAEITYWSGLLSDGIMSRENVFNSFTVSPEFENICSTYGITRGGAVDVSGSGTVPTGACTVTDCPTVIVKVDAFVRRLYIQCLARTTVDDSEIVYYRTQLLSRAITGTLTAWHFFSSPEFTGQGLSDEDYIGRLYSVLMDRAPAAAEVSYHASRLAAGASRLDIFNGFAMSPEFLNVCNSYGIERGNVITETVVTPTYRALLAANTHAGSSDPRPANATDARTMKAMLESMTATPYTCTVSIDRTASQMLSDIADAFAGATENDVSLYFFSGHGASGTGTLVGNDMYGVTFAQLRDALDQIPGRKIVLLGSCFSGQAINKAEGSEDTAQDEAAAWAEAAAAAFREELAKSGELAAGSYYVITAAAKDESSYSTARFGWFARCLEQVCGWNELSNSSLSTMSADTNGDKMITLQEAFTGTYNAVMANSPFTVQVSPGVYENYYMHIRVYPENSSFVLYGRS